MQTAIIRISDRNILTQFKCCVHPVNANPYKCHVFIWEHSSRGIWRVGGRKGVSLEWEASDPGHLTLVYMCTCELRAPIPSWTYTYIPGYEMNMSTSYSGNAVDYHWEKDTHELWVWLAELQKYSKTVLGCKEHRRYEMGVKKIVFRGRRPRKRIFWDNPSSIDDVPATSHCFAIIIYLISPINHELMPIYRAEQSGPYQMLLPAPIW